MKIDGNEVSSLGKCDGCPLWQSGQLSPKQLSLDDFNKVILCYYQYYGGEGGHACAAIVLIYREA